MYREDYFYGLSDILHFNVLASFLKDNIIKEERGIVKIFKRNNELVVIENFNGKDEVLKDTRKDKNEELINFDLIFLKAIERYYSDYELKGMVYEYIEGLGAWYRVKIEGYNPSNKLLRPFYYKRLISGEKLKDLASNDKDYNYIKKFFDIKGDIVFNKPHDVKRFFKKIEN